MDPINPVYEEMISNKGKPNTKVARIIKTNKKVWDDNNL